MALVTVTRAEDVLHVHLDAPPVNALTAAARAELVDILAKADQSDVGALLLTTAGRTFIAGADISEFETGMALPDMHELVDRIDSMGLLTVAAIQGPALGGGLEVAMACDLRVASSAATFGLPEVTLGILAAAGGTQRLARLVGPEPALAMAALGKTLSAQEALEVGLVDGVVAPERLLPDAIALARRWLASAERPVKARCREAKLEVARARPGLYQAFRHANEKRLRGRLAAGQNIQAVEAAATLAFSEGRALEKRLLQTALASDQAPALRYAFLSQSQAQKVPDIPLETPDIPVARVGVVGAGTMGGGIAMACANAGLDVVLVDQTASALERGLGVIRGNYAHAAARGALSDYEIASRLGRIDGVVGLEALKDVDLVIEAAFERIDVKREIFRSLDAICKPGAVLGTNTSGLDINAIAAVTGRPEFVIGLHFASPAHVTRGVEVIRGDKTSREVVATGMKLSRRIGKLPVLVGVTPGFVANRTMYPYRRAAIALVAEGAMPWEVDQAVYDFGFPMGPFAMHDLAGLDVGWTSGAATGDILRDRLCEIARFGQKSGAGYYDYASVARSARPKPWLGSSEPSSRRAASRSARFPRRR